MTLPARSARGGGSVRDVTIHKWQFCSGSFESVRAESLLQPPTGYRKAPACAGAFFTCTRRAVLLDGAVRIRDIFCVPPTKSLDPERGLFRCTTSRQRHLCWITRRMCVPPPRGIAPECRPQGWPGGFYPGCNRDKASHVSLALSAGIQGGQFAASSNAMIGTGRIGYC